MEEKEILNTEETIGEVIEETSENVTEEILEDNATELTDVVAEENSEEILENTELSEINLEEIEAVNKSKKKKRIICISSIIASIILVVCVVLFAGYKLLLTPTITGTWVYTEDLTASEEDGAELPYLVFNKNGVASYDIGSLSYYGPYSVTTTDGVSTLTASIPYALSGDFEIALTGNNLTGKTLAITSEGTTLEFVSIKKEATSIAIPTEFKLVEEVVGTWTNEEQGLTYDINSDGTMTFHITSDDIGMDIKGTYYVSDGTINFVYLTDENVDMPIVYTINENGNLVVEEVEFVNTRTTSK